MHGSEKTSASIKEEKVGQVVYSQLVKEKRVKICV